MADFYVLYYSLENSIRRLVAGRLAERHGAGWWDQKVPAGSKPALQTSRRKRRIRRCRFGRMTPWPIATLVNS